MTDAGNLRQVRVDRFIPRGAAGVNEMFNQTLDALRSDYENQIYELRSQLQTARVELERLAVFKLEFEHERHRLVKEVEGVHLRYERRLGEKSDEIRALRAVLKANGIEGVPM